MGTGANRLARHLFDVATTAAPGKEVRVTRIAKRLIAGRRSAWERWYAPVASARRCSAIWHAVAWSIFGAAYAAAIVFVASILKASAGSVLLLLAAGSRLSSYVAATVGEIGFLRGIWLDGSRRLAWLEDYAASLVEHRDEPVPHTLDDGIRVENVSFCYPGTDCVVLEDLNLHFKPGSVIAIVGENGAGKTTLVKLLCGLYPPMQGRILINGVELARVDPDAWRSRDPDSQGRQPRAARGACPQCGVDCRSSTTRGRGAHEVSHIRARKALRKFRTSERGSKFEMERGQEMLVEMTFR